MNKVYLKHILKCFILISMFSILGCSNKSDLTKYKIGFSQCISKDDWRKAMDYEMQVEASLYSELDLAIFQANGDT